MKLHQRFLCIMLLLTAMWPLCVQADDRPKFTIWENTFENDMGECTFTQNFDDFSYFDEDWNLNLPDYDAWSHDDENKCAVAITSGYYIMELFINTPFIDMTDPMYYNPVFTMEVKGSCAGVNVYATGENGEDLGGGEVFSYLPNSDSFVLSNEVLLSKCSGKKFKLRISIIGFSDKLYVRNLKLSANHITDNLPVTEVNYISEILSLPSETYIKWTTHDVLQLDWVSNKQFCRDETGAIMQTSIIYGGFGEPGMNYNGTTIYAQYIKENGIPKIRNISHYGFDFDNTPSVSIVPKKITDEEYWANICNYVSMPIKEPVYIMSAYDYDDSYTGWVEPINNIEVTGFVYPTDDGKKGFLWTYSEVPPSKIIYSDTQTNIYNQESVGKSAYLRRHFEKGKWHSLVLPFDSYFNGYPARTMAVMTSSDNGVLQFQTATKVEAGHPFLVKFSSNEEQIYGVVSLGAEEPVNTYGGDYVFCGALNEVSPKDGSYYLSEGNTIRPLAHGGKIKAFRAYFEPNTSNAAPARAISIDGVVTAIEDFPLADELFAPTGKVYTVSGQYVGDDLEALPKGMYIVNGKKVIK